MFYKKGLAVLLAACALMFGMPGFTTETRAAASMPVPIETGSGTESDPYIINSADELAWMAQQVNATEGEMYRTAYYKLGGDIDLSAYGARWNRGQGWIPIGDEIPFQGVFDGGGYQISGLYASYGQIGSYWDPQQRVGLFGGIENGTIKNLGLINVNVKSAGRVGGLVGGATQSEISNSYVTGNVWEALGGHNDVGGLASNTYYTNITNSFFSGNVSGYDSVGGLVGYSDQSNVSNSYAVGRISATNGEVGGLFGRAEYGSVTNSYFQGEVHGSIYAGGLAGYSYAHEISNSYAMGDVIGLYANVGGLAGNLSDGSSIENSAAVNSSVNGYEGVGRIVGGEYYGNNTVSNNRAASDMSSKIGQGFATPGAIYTHDSLNGEDASRNQFLTASFWTTDTATWDGWDPDVWNFVDGKYPTLKNMPSVLELEVSDAFASPGEVFSLTVYLRDNPGVAGFDLTIEYDEEVLTPIEATPGLSGSVFISNINEVATAAQLSTPGQLTAVWASPNDRYAEELLTVWFRVNRDLEYGADEEITTPVNIFNADIKYASLEDALAIGQSGHVYIGDDSLWGDANNDGRVDVKDMISMAKHLASIPGEGLDEEGRRLADVNRDGAIDVADLILLVQHLESPGYPYASPVILGIPR